MITLYGFDPAFGMPSASPFVVKTMIQLSIADRPFETEFVQDYSTAPKGKLPYISDRGTLIADSELIRKHLERQYGVDLDAGLSARQRAEGVAFSRLAEDHLYWCLMYHHWQIGSHWQVMKPAIFEGVPSDQLDAIAEGVREQVVRDLHSQGLGRHGEDELLMLAKDDLDALGEALGDGPYWFGERLTAADAAIAPQIQCIAGDPLDGPLNQALEAHPRLVAYAKRVIGDVFPDRTA